MLSVSDGFTIVLVRSGVTLCGWLGSKHQLTNQPTIVLVGFPNFIDVVWGGVTARKLDLGP